MDNGISAGTAECLVSEGRRQALGWTLRANINMKMFEWRGELCTDAWRDISGYITREATFDLCLSIDPDDLVHPG